MTTFAKSEKPVVYSLKQVAQEYGGEIIRRAKNITERYGMSTGWNELDNLLRGGGLLPGLLYIVAGRPGMGKTTLMQDLAVNLAKQGNPTIIFSLELTRSRLLERLAYQESGIDYMEHFRTGTDLSEAQIEQLRVAIRNLMELPVYVQDMAGITPGLVTETMNHYTQEYKLKAMFIDYLHIMRPDGRIYGGGREREIGTMVEQIRDAAKQLGVTCVLASQLNRDVETASPFIPSLYHLRDSGSIEQVAYTVFGLYRRDYYVQRGMLKETNDEGEPVEPTLDGSIDVIVLKQQDGPTGTAHLKFVDATGKISDW